MNITEAAIPVDLSLMAFQEAVAVIRGQPNQVTLWCAHANVCTAYKIREQYNCNVVLIPDELARNKFTWGIIANDSMYWSPIVP